MRHESSSSALGMHATTGAQRILHPPAASVFSTAAAIGPGSAVSGFHKEQLSMCSLSQPIGSATSADFDDAIMESVETEVFEGDVAGPSGSASARTNSSQFHSSSSAAMACLAHGFSRLPDRGPSAAAAAAPRCNVGGGGGGGGAASASAVTGGGNGTASATLTEALRCGGGGAGTGYGATLVRSSVVAVESLALKPAGVSHDGVISSAATGRVVSNGGCGGKTQGSDNTQGSGGGAPVTHIAMGQQRRQLRPPPPSSQLFGMGLDGSGPGEMAALGLAAARHPPQNGVAGAVNSQYGVPGWASGSGTLPFASGGATAGSCSSTSSTVHPALAQVLAGAAAAAAAAAASGRSVSGTAATAVPPHANLNLPFTVSEGTAVGAIASGAGGGGGGNGGSIGAAAALGSRSQSLSWDLGAISPIPVMAAQRPQAPGLAGSIAAAAFRSVSSLTGHPSLAAPYGSDGGGAAATVASASSSLAGAAGPRGGRLHVGARHMQTFFGGHHAPPSHSEPWAPAAKTGHRQSSLAAAAGGGGGVFLPSQLFDVLPDISAGTADQDGVNDLATVALVAGGGVGVGLGPEPDAVSAAVRALLRMDQPFDLPYTQKLPPPEFETALRAPSAAGADLHGVFGGDAVAFAPELPPAAPLPPLPVPASLIACLEPSGVPAVDRYLHQLLQDTCADRHVFLCKRPLGTAACRAIASCLRLCPGVKSITLSSGGITCEGLSALCEGLRTCREVLFLDLSYNAIGDDGAAALAGCLADMPQLASLTLAGNADLTDVGVVALAAALRSGGGGGGSLRRVVLRGTAASQLGHREVASALAANLKRSARRGSIATLAAAGAPAAAVAQVGGGERPVTWDGTTRSGTAGAADDAVFIAQSCELLRTFALPSLPAEQAVAEAVAELLAAAPPGSVAAAAPPPLPGDGTAGAAGGGGESSDLLSYLADGLKERGYDVAVTHALGGGAGGECLRNLRHTFLSVSCPLPPPGACEFSGPPSPAAAAVAAASLAQSAASGGAGGRRRAIGAAATNGAIPLPYHSGVIIVDPELREQFEVATPTPRYEALVSALPRVYVGAEERLPMVVEVLCDEMARALRSKGMVIPPWRESSAMISKWQPKQSRLLVPGAATAAGGAGGNERVVFGSGSASARSSASVTPRVSLAGGIAAAAAGGGGRAICTAPLPMLHRRLGGAGDVGAGGAAAGGGGGGQQSAARAAAAAAEGVCGEDGEPSLGPPPSLGSGAGSSRPDGSPLVQSFGFRRCSSDNSLSFSVGLMAPSSSGVAAAVEAALGLRGGVVTAAAGLAAAFASTTGASPVAPAVAPSGGGACNGGSYISFGIRPAPPVTCGQPRVDSPAAAVAAAGSVTHGG